MPISAFREPCYWGEPAGKEVYFAPTDGSLLYAAGLYSVWNEQYTMTLVMRPACDYVMECGHRRQPFFLRPDAPAEEQSADRNDGFDKWLDPEPLTLEQSHALLRKYAAEPELTYTIDREMAPSWTKRQKAKLKERDEQLDEIQRTGLELGI